MPKAEDVLDLRESPFEQSEEGIFLLPEDYQSHHPKSSKNDSAALLLAGLIPTLTLSDSNEPDSPDAPKTDAMAVSATDSPKNDEKDAPEDPKAETPGDPKPDAPAASKPEVAVTRTDNEVVGARDERTRLVDGTKVTVRTPVAEKHKHTREVEIDGEKIKLARSVRSGQKWFYSEMKEDAAVEQVKLHVAGLDAEDVARLQKELLPVLEKMRKEGSVSHYKTYDPNFLDPAWESNPARFGQPPAASGQNSKAFSIYLPTEKAAQVAAALDKILVEKKLTLPADHKTDTVGDTTRAKTESKRVSTERDMFEAVSEYPGGNKGALIDPRVQKELTAAYGLLGMNGKDLSWDALRQIEKDAGLAPEQLTYDRNGRMIFITPASIVLDNGQYYADESTAQKTPGKLTGRPAIYALYEVVDMDPATVRMEDAAAEKSAAKAAPTQDAGKDAAAKAEEKVSASLKRALELAKDIALDGPEIKTAEQVKQLLKGTLEELDRDGSWTEKQRDEFLEFQKSYTDGNAEAVRALHGAIGIPLPTDSDKTAGGPPKDATIQDLKRDSATAEQRTAASASYLKEGPVKQVLVARGVTEEKAKELAKDLVSDNEERREKAAKEIAQHFQTRGGMRTFMSEAKGRAGAAAIIVGTVIPQVADK